MKLKRLRRLSLLVPALMALLLIGGCSQKKQESQRKVVEVPSARPEQPDTTPMHTADIAMVMRSFADELNMGGTLDSATYDMHAILTDGQGKPLYFQPDSIPGDWRVHVESPKSVVIRNLHLGNLLAEDLRIYVASALGLTDADVSQAGIAEGTKNVQAVVYTRNKLRLEITMTPELDNKQKEHVWMTLSLINTK